MTRQEKLEILGLALVTGIVARVSSHLPPRLALSDALLGGACFLLVQGLVRDLARLATRSPSVPASASRITCMCVESTLGLGAIVAGTLLLFAWTPIRFRATPSTWTLGVAALGAFGFLTRALVFDWKRGRVRRGEDHDGIVSLRG